MSSNQDRWYREKISYVFATLAKAIDELNTTIGNIQYTEGQLVTQKKRKEELLTIIDELKQVVKDRYKELDHLDNPSGRQT